METVHAFVVKRKDGELVNIRWEPVTSIKKAFRFYNPEDFELFVQGHYKPDKPEDYYLQMIEIVYKEVEPDV